MRREPCGRRSDGSVGKLDGERGGAGLRSGGEAVDRKLAGLPVLGGVMTAGVSVGVLLQDVQMIRG